MQLFGQNKVLNLKVLQSKVRGFLGDFERFTKKTNVYLTESEEDSGEHKSL